MNQGLVPAGFFAFDVAFSALVNGRFSSIGCCNPSPAPQRAHQSTGFSRRRTATLPKGTPMPTTARLRVDDKAPTCC
jgi:hypothetical protein